MILRRQNETQWAKQGDRYTARLARHMFNVTKRKALFAARLSASFITESISAVELQAIDIVGNISRPYGPVDVPDPADGLDPLMPTSLSEYLELLAKELEQAESDLPQD